MDRDPATKTTGVPFADLIVEELSGVVAGERPAIRELPDLTVGKDIGETVEIIGAEPSLV